MADPTPKADGLRRMREATRGHLQATAERVRISDVGGPGDLSGGKAVVKFDPVKPKPARKRKKLKRKTS